VRIALALVFIVSAVVLMPLAASAQQTPKMPRIGLLSVGSDPSRPLSPQWLAFLDGLRALGYVERQNIVIERRFAAGKSERVAGMASELVQLGVDIIVATGLRENQAARQATRTIPIVMVVVDDPVEAGFVESLARPGGNVTAHGRRGKPADASRASQGDAGCRPDYAHRAFLPNHGAGPR